MFATSECTHYAAELCTGNYKTGATQMHAQKAEVLLGITHLVTVSTAE
jgi:hypothetical protein